VAHEILQPDAGDRPRRHRRRPRGAFSLPPRRLSGDYAGGGVYLWAAGAFRWDDDEAHENSRGPRGC